MRKVRNHSGPHSLTACSSSVLGHWEHWYVRLEVDNYFKIRVPWHEMFHLLHRKIHFVIHEDIIGLGQGFLSYLEVLCGPTVSITADSSCVVLQIAD